MTRADKIKYAVIAGLVLIVVLLLVSLFSGKGSTDNSTYKELIKAKDETIKAIQGERDAYILLTQEKDKSIAVSERKDSVLLQTIINNQAKYTANEKRYQNIPFVVSNWSKDSLRLAISRY